MSHQNDMKLTEIISNDPELLKGETEHIDDLTGENVDPAIAKLREEIGWVRGLSAEERLREERSLKRKLDLRMMPILFILIALNYLDRNALPAARVQGIDKDLKLVGNQYNVAISVLFIGYILGQIPSNMILAKVRPSLYLSGWVAIWGVVSGCTAAATTYSHLVVIRFFLGFTESPYFAGAMFLLSSWYTKKEVALRMSILFSGSLLSGAFSGLIGAGIQANLAGKNGLKSWQWLFIIESVLTVFFAGVALFALPDYPATTRWLTPKHRALAVVRMSEDSQGSSDEGSQTLAKSFKLALMDYRLWLLALIQVSKTTAAAVTSFIPTVVATFGYSSTNTLLLTVPPYVLATVLSLAVSASSDHFKERGLHLAAPIAVALIGNIIAATTTTTAPRYFALFLLLAGVYASFNVCYAWIGSTFSRPRAKRAAAFALVNALANLAQVWSPYLYDSGYAPRYSVAFATNSAMCFLAICSCLTLKYLLNRSNKQMDQREADAEASGRAAPQAIRYVI